MLTEQLLTKNEAETILLGTSFAKRLKSGDVVALFGELGSGKTEFIKGICNAFHVTEIVNSPTFTIINQYSGHIHNHTVEIYHLDLYRIKSPAELNDIGFFDCLADETSIKLIEWAERAGPDFSSQNYNVRIELDESEEDIRHITIEAC